MTTEKPKQCGGIPSLDCATPTSCDEVGCARLRLAAPAPADAGGYDGHDAGLVAADLQRLGTIGGLDRPGDLTTDLDSVSILRVQKAAGYAVAELAKYRARPALTPPAGEVGVIPGVAEIREIVGTMLRRGRDEDVLAWCATERASVLHWMGEARALATQAREAEGLRETLAQVEHEVAEVYTTLTEGRFAKCSTAAEYVIERVNELHERDLAELRQVADALRAELGHAEGQAALWRSTAIPAEVEVDTLLARVAELEEDRERLDWISQRYEYSYRTYERALARIADGADPRATIDEYRAITARAEAAGGGDDDDAADNELAARYAIEAGGEDE